MRAAERGVSILFVAVVLLFVAGAALAFLALTRSATGVDRSNETLAHLAKAQAALEQFAATAERLPCPADPAADTGDEVPAGGAASCALPTGTLPWRTIGLKRDEALDAWGWKIDYRVYQGARGLTQPGGASMVHCDTVEPSPAGTAANGLCLATHDTSEAQFLSGKGLAVDDFGTAFTDAAYVLISHGPSGLGAYASGGGRKQPGPANAAELANLGATGPFVAKAAAVDVAAEAPGYFDDVLAYRRLADFVKRANLPARDWPEAGTIASVTFNTATMTAALGSTPSYGNTGRSALAFTNATVSGFDSGGTQNLSFDSQAGAEGIGGAGGNPYLSSAAGEGLRITLTAKARQFAATFAHFGRFTGAGAPREQAEFRFFDGATPVYTVTKQGCRPDGGLASFSIDAGADFDRVEIVARPPTSGAAPSEFLLAQILACAPAVACDTALSAGPPNNACP